MRKLSSLLLAFIWFPLAYVWAKQFYRSVVPVWDDGAIIPLLACVLCLMAGIKGMVTFIREIKRH